MHAAHGPLSDIVGNVRLRNGGLQSVRSEFLLTESTSEKAAGILPAFEVNDVSSFEFRFRKYHGALLN
jgi:hypothetical protein